jgi:hypothetical protein
MRLPGFNAESALGPARHHYRGRVSHGAGGAPLAPQQYFDEEVMEEIDEEVSDEEELSDEMEEDLGDSEEMLV